MCALAFLTIHGCSNARAHKFRPPSEICFSLGEENRLSIKLSGRVRRRSCIKMRCELLRSLNNMLKCNQHGYNGISRGRYLSSCPNCHHSIRPRGYLSRPNLSSSSSINSYAGRKPSSPSALFSFGFGNVSCVPPSDVYPWSYNEM